VTAGRWLASYLVGLVVTSGLNWFTAEKILNPMIKPGLGPLMRDAGSTQIGVLTGGFALLVAVLAAFLVLVREPAHWASRALVVGGLLSLGTFFGSYTFLSGWTALPTAEMCRTAIADSITVVVGALVIAFVQDYGRTSRVRAGPGRGTRLGEAGRIPQHPQPPTEGPGR
jgi:hypothetical protein